ncbi:MAG TPA: hypothetical protein VKB41_00580 [Steroidobacteraceae bacterium]|nr:hypothetical protein [Steroidobacteraceae bacterium]
MYLANYMHLGRPREFDPNTGAVRPLPAGAKPDTWGAVWKKGGKWFALRLDSESLLFQRGPDTWRLRPENEFSVSYGRLAVFRRFTITRQNEVVFSFKYCLGISGTFLMFFSSTYDYLDEEADDFFVYVVSVWNGWKDQPIAAFEARVAPRNETQAES